MQQKYQSHNASIDPIPIFTLVSILSIFGSISPPLMVAQLVLMELTTPTGLLKPLESDSGSKDLQYLSFTHLVYQSIA